MGTVVRRLWRWLRSRIAGRWVRNVVCLAAADEVPDSPDKGVVIIVGTMHRMKWVVFDCPCRRGHTVWLNAQEAQSPHWRLSGSTRDLTLWPSIWVGGPWGCHFWLRQGRIVWTLARPTRLASGE